MIVYVGSELYGIKWRNYKMRSKEIDKAFADPYTPGRSVHRLG